MNYKYFFQGLLQNSVESPLSLRRISGKKLLKGKESRKGNKSNKLSGKEKYININLT